LAAGRYDGNLTAWATALQGLGYPILLRFAHEMNGGWYPWGVGVGTNTPGQYVAAWRHAHGVFQAAGATNVLWVWCIAAGGQQGPIPSLYPGDPYVDWLSIDGYSRDGKQTFVQAMQPAYGTLTGLSDKPVLVAETGCAESTTDASFKPNWITDAFLTQIPSNMTRIRAVCYFDGPGGGNFTYPWDSSPASQAAMASVFSSGMYTI
jgi:beta-mannanase